MPEAELKVSNIDSRLSYLRKRFNALQDIKQKDSEFGWDDNHKMVTGDRKLFDDWAKSHKDARGMFRKSFSFYDDLELIYSKDKATGSKAILPADKDDEETMLQDTTPGKEEEDVPSEVSATNKRIVDEGSSKDKAKKKVRKNKEIQNMQKKLETMLEKLIESSNEQIEKLVSVLEAPKNSKSGLREELGKVRGISRAQALLLCKKMNEDDIVIFRDLQDEDEKYDFLMIILDQV
ncbi:unnamed protein product [Amaranthus hypochondriacus]